MLGFRSRHDFLSQVVADLFFHHVGDEWNAQRILRRWVGWQYLVHLCLLHDSLCCGERIGLCLSACDGGVLLRFADQLIPLLLGDVSLFHHELEQIHGKGLRRAVGLIADQIGLRSCGRWGHGLLLRGLCSGIGWSCAVSGLRFRRWCLRNWRIGGNCGWFASFWGRIILRVSWSDGKRGLYGFACIGSRANG